MNIAIIGPGHVGLVTGACFADLGNKVICFDIDKAKIESLIKGIVPFYEPGLEEIVARNIKNNRLSFTTDIKETVLKSLVIFITVGTPPKISGEANLAYVEKAARDIANIIPDYRLIVEKSTVPVNTGNQVKRTISENLNKNIEFDVASNPEFLSEGNAIKDFLEPDRVVIGVESQKAEEILRDLYKPLETTIIVTDINSAELIKHASNSFLATKISFINAVAQICEKTGANVGEVAKGMGLDSRIGDKFLKAGIGYGGSCFPKDVDAFMHITDGKGCDSGILKAVKKVNEEQRVNFVKKIKDALWVIEGKNIAVWGLSFKPGTDDIRHAPSIDIINSLLKDKANIRVYDPQIKKIDDEFIDGDIKLSNDMYEVAKEADCILILTEWNEFKEVDLEKVKTLLRQPLIIDGRNLYDLGKMEKLGFRYVSVGRPSSMQKLKTKK